MIYLLLFLLPAGFSLKLKDDFFKEEIKTKDYILLFIEYAFIINLIMFTVLYLYSHGKEASIVLLFDEIGFVFKFLIVSFVVSVFVPFVEQYLRKYIDLKISIKKIEDKDVKKFRK